MRNTFALIALTLTVLLSGFETRAQLGTIATAQLNGGGGIHAILDPNLRLTIGYNVPTNTPMTTIFGQFTFHTNNVGTVFSIDQFSDPGFIDFVSRATNGILNSLTESFYAGGSFQGRQLPETSFFT